MKRSLLFLALLLVCAGLQAQMIDQLAPLKTYAARSLPRCPDGVLTLEPVQGGPANFVAYTVTIRSSDQYCGTQKYLIASPKTQQILIGAVVNVQPGGQPLATRIGEEASRLMGNKVTATVAPFPLQDGLKAVNLTRDTAFGAFTLHGFVDASERFLIIGSRGNLKTDPAQTIRETLGTSNAVRKGNSVAKFEVLEFSDFQCPSCARAHKTIDPIIEKNLSKVNYGRLDLPLFEHHEWALQAAMAARAIQRVAPKKYWAYADYLFKNQEEIGKQNFDKFLQGYLEDHDIDAAAVQKIYASKAEREILLDQVSRAFSIGIAATPTFIINGQMMGFGPEGNFTIDAIKKGLGLPVGTAAAPKKSK
jgi:protein-disulfide isomerase